MVKLLFFDKFCNNHVLDYQHFFLCEHNMSTKFIIEKIQILLICGGQSNNIFSSLVFCFVPPNWLISISYIYTTTIIFLKWVYICPTIWLLYLKTSFWIEVLDRPIGLLEPYDEKQCVWINIKNNMDCVKGSSFDVLLIIYVFPFIRKNPTFWIIVFN